jgi:hypothetical protein
VNFKAKKQMWSGLIPKPSALTASYLHLYTTLQQSKNLTEKIKLDTHLFGGFLVYSVANDHNLTLDYSRLEHSESKSV